MSLSLSLFKSKFQHKNKITNCKLESAASCMEDMDQKTMALATMEKEEEVEEVEETTSDVKKQKIGLMELPTEFVPSSHIQLPHLC